MPTGFATVHVMAKRVTLRDVASHAGVSRATASYVVMGTGRVSDATRARVRESMAALGYVYHQAAGSLRRRTAQAVGVIVTNIDRPFFGELLIGLESTLTESGYMPFVVSTRDNLEHQARAIRMLREHQVAALAMIPATGSGQPLVDAIDDWGVPTVFMTRYLRDHPMPYIGPDDVAGGHLAAAHLIEHGCRTLTYIGGPAEVVSRWDRIAGAKRAINESRLDVTLSDVTSESTGPGGYEVGCALARGDELADGIMCHNDAVAMGFERALHDTGYSKPVRVIGYDDVTATRYWVPALTSVATNGQRLGELAAQALLRAVDGDAPVESFLETPRLAIRESCGDHASAHDSPADT